MKNIQFIKESLKSLKEVGTILPSSKFVIEKMVEPINFEKKLTIFELGPGGGVITKKLLEKIRNIKDWDMAFKLILWVLLNNNLKIMSIVY